MILCYDMMQYLGGVSENILEFCEERVGAVGG
jgi:hypothetical protein